jgi:hypothetical protein
MCCPYHDWADKSQFCSLTFVKQWAFIMSNFLLKDHGLGHEPGRHCPPKERLPDQIPQVIPATAQMGGLAINLGTVESVHPD